MASYAVIGAGAAGISAARTLQGAGHSVTVFEARDRPGGRALTDYTFAPHPVELGAEFIHGERVSTWDWIREFDAETNGDAHRYEMWFALGGKLIDAPAARKQFGTDPIFALHRLATNWQASGRPETTLDHVFELWSEISNEPLTAERRAIIEGYMAELASTDVADLGTHVYDEPVDRGLINFRISGGYTRLMQQAAGALDIRYSTVVRRIRWDDATVEISTGAQVQRFDAAVVTLPLGVLRKGTVEFDPPLPADKLDAIARINAGSISKVVLKFDEVMWPPDHTFIWTPNSMQLWWRPGQGQPNEAPVITAFFGGSAAKSLEAATAVEATDEACRQLGDMLGRSVAGKLVDSRYIAWGAEEHTLMGYSSLPPEGRGLRETLGAPVGALHFAGEATSLTHAATVDGAIDSGRQAARELLD